MTIAPQLRQFQPATLHQQLEVRHISRLAQLLDAGATAKHRRREVKCLGHDGREIELLTCQHGLIDQSGALLRQALAALVAFRPQRRGHLLGQCLRVGDAQLTQQVQRRRQQVAESFAPDLAFVQGVVLLAAK